MPDGSGEKLFWSETLNELPTLTLVEDRCYASNVLANMVRVWQRVEVSDSLALMLQTQTT